MLPSDGQINRFLITNKKMKAYSIADFYLNVFVAPRNGMDAHYPKRHRSAKVMVL